MATWRSNLGLASVVLFSLWGCNGTQMLKKGDQALEFSTKGDRSVRGVDGEALNLARQRSRGPVMLVFLRGFG